MFPDGGYDTLVRRVAVAVELVDPATGERVVRGMTLTAEAADGRRLPGGFATNRSGRFAWLDDDARPPARIVCDPGRLPYAREEIDLSDWTPGPRPEDRLVTRTLRATHAYDVPDGITAVRGRLVDGATGEAVAIEGAFVQIVWGIERKADGIPPAPAGIERLRPGEAVTDGKGAFLALSRPPLGTTRYSTYVGHPAEGQTGFDPTPVSLDIADGLLRAQLRVTRPDLGASRVTPATFRFSQRLPPGRLADGQMPAPDIEIDWHTLE